MFNFKKKLQFLTFTLLLASIILLPTGVATAQLKATLEGHTDNVWSVAFSPNGKMLASASWDQTVRIWNVNTGRLLHTLTEHTNEVLSVAFSPDGNTLASADWDGTMHLWNPRNGTLKRTLTGHAGGVTSVAFSPDGRTLASGSADRTVRLWNPNNGKLKRTLIGHTNTVDAVAFSPDGDILASGSRDTTVRLWNPNNGKLKRTLTGHTDEVQRIAFSSDGDILASGSRDTTIRLWNPHTGRVKQILTGYTDGINPVAFSPDGETLLIGGRGISVWSTQTDQYKKPLAGDIGNPFSVVFSPDGEMVATGSGDHKVHLFDLTRYVPDIPFADIAFDITNIPEPVPPPAAVRDFFELDTFYQQWINVGGLPLLASEKVNPYALKEAAWLIWQMIGHRPDVLKALAESQDRIYLLAIDEAYSDLPEYEFADHPLSFLIAFTRDIVITNPVPGMLAAEENLLRPDSHFPHFLIHEFAHKIHGGLKLLGTEFDNRLKVAYDAAMQKGLWSGYYAASNRDEYWAEGTNTWFHSTQTNAVNTRSALKKYDPALAKLLTEIYDDNNLLYTPPATRTHLPHLQGFNPRAALTFDGPHPWQIGIQKLDRQLKNPNSDGDGKWVNLELHDPSELPNLLASTTKGNHTVFFFVNLTGHEISFYFLDDDGSENLVYRSTTRWIYDLGSRAGTIWLAKDHTGEELAVFRAEEKTGRVFFGSSSNKIMGPWLWMIAPTENGQGGARSTDVDSLSDASNGRITEADVAANGAREGDAVGPLVWTLGEIADTGDNNVSEIINEIGLASGDVDDHSSYALITLESTTAQSDVTMRVGSDDSIKVWLNGEVVHNNPINRGANDFQDTFKVNLVAGDNLLLVKVSDRESGWSMFVGIDADVNAVYKRPLDPVVSEDVNRDGIVNILDLVSVSSNFGKTGENIADVNGDGTVNIVDLVKVAGEMGAAAAAPAAHPQTLEILTAADVQQWLTQAQYANLTDTTSQRGILMLAQLLAALPPKETSLLPNYPNPFNPETWIPYQLAEPAEVTLHIYVVNGTLIRTLTLGHQPAGIYQSKNRAAYWDGKNEVGEPVASGVYFYTLTAGDFIATRKMLIRK